jgi:hypothetical protein
MRIWSPWLAPSAKRTVPDPVGAPAPLVVDIVSGRLRWYCHLAIASLGASGAWTWFGLSGLLPLLLWAWYRQPLPGRPRRYVLGRVTAVRLGLYRTVATGPGCSRIEIFRDELPPEDLAALRRRLMAECSAGNRPQDVEPV